MILADFKSSSNLGFSICTSSDCADGDGQIAAMQSAFRQLVDGGRIDEASYAPSVKSIQDAADSYSWWSRFMDTACCPIRDLGRQAQDLTQKMYAAANVVGPAPTLEPHPDINPVADIGSALKPVLWTVGIVGALGLTALIGVKVYEARKLTASR